MPADISLDWLNRANGGRLAIGGKLREELCSNRNFLRWLSVAGRLGRTINVSDDHVDAETESLRIEADLQVR